MASEADEPVASSSTSHLLSAEKILSSPAHTLPLDILEQSIRNLVPAAQLVVCANLVLSGKFIDQTVLRRIIELGLEGGAEEIELLEGDVRSRLDESDRSPGDGWNGWSIEEVSAQVDSVLDGDSPRRAIVSSLAILNDARRRIDTFDAFYPPVSRPTSRSQQRSEQVETAEEPIELDDPWADADKEDEEDVAPILDDPWGEEDAEEDEAGHSSKQLESEPSSPPIDASTFILESLVLSALYFATGAHLRALRVVCQRHAAELWPYRLALVEVVPGWISPAEDDMLPLMPTEGHDGEGSWPRGVVDSAQSSFVDLLIPRFGIASLKDTSSDLFPARQEAKISSEALTNWYNDRVFALDDLGLIDSQLAWIQHGAALGITGLDAVGEDLSLLSRLIYDANLSPQQLEQWSLATWREASEDEIIRAYLANATPDNIVEYIRRLVLPYLYVLESRAERSGNPDPGLVQRSLDGVILDLPLNLALPCFEASQATLPTSARLIKDDQTVARLALAILYGSDQKDAFSTMSAIFECLPVWDVSGGDLDSDKEATETTLASIADFVRPTVSSAGPHSARELFLFFKPLPFSSLSRALDILDVHLESGEILSRYHVPVYLRTLLQSARDHQEQIGLAEKMVRRQTARGDDRKWVTLWEDMCRLQGENDSLLRGAFGVLSKDEMMRIFLHGLLSAGSIPVAKQVIRRLEPEGHFTAKDLEGVVLTTSKEFYMRAETGNIHTGDMKLAFDCLSVVPETPAISAEQDFIQATSRITSFRSPSLSSLTPAEIRHTPNKLDLIRKVLSTSDDAYKHQEIIMELTDKLGYRDDKAAHAEVLAMMCDAAVAAEEWGIAKERVDEMVLMAEPDIGHAASEDEVSSRVRDVVWRSCLALGRQSEYPDLVGRMALLAQAVALCPAEEVPVILPLWRQAEQMVSSHPELLRQHAMASVSQTSSSSSSPTEARMLGSRTAARAARLAFDNLRSFTASPALSGGGPLSRHDSRNSTTSRGSVGRRDTGGMRDAAALFGEDEHESVVRAGAKRALVKGVGWLLGAEEGDV